MRAVRLLAGSFLVGMMIGAAPLGAAAKKNFVYVHDRSASDNRVWGYAVDAAGQLTDLPNSPYGAAGTPTGGCTGLCQTAVYAAKRKLLVVGGNGLSVFRVNADGSLTLVPGGPFAAASDLTGTSVVERGKKTFVYATEFDFDQVRGFEVQADGSLLELAGSPFACGDGPTGAAGAAGKLFVALENSNAISAFTVANDGTLNAAPGSPFAVAGGFIYNVQPSPDGKFVYTGSVNPDEVFAFSVNKNTGVLTAVAGSPFASPIDPEQGTGSSKNLLIAQENNGAGVGDIQVFARNKQSGVLAPLGGAQSSGVDNARVSGLDAKGKLYAVAGHEGGGLLATFQVDKNTGVLTPGDTASPALGKPNQVLFVQR
jgi:6-phosphogluconolactonase